MTRDTPSALARLNALPSEEAVEVLLSCCAVRVWARAVADGRPYESVEDLQARGVEQYAWLSGDDVERAVAAHPALGERSEAAWSRQEQAGTASASDGTKAALAEGNRAYERRFGRTFLICATGLSADQMVRSLQDRLGNDEETERAAVREELRKITVLRLAKLADGNGDGDAGGRR